MKKFFGILGILALASILQTGSARAEEYLRVSCYDRDTLESVVGMIVEPLPDEEVEVIEFNRCRLVESGISFDSEKRVTVMFVPCEGATCVVSINEATNDGVHFWVEDGFALAVPVDVFEEALVFDYSTQVPIIALGVPGPAIDEVMIAEKGDRLSFDKVATAD